MKVLCTTFPIYQLTRNVVQSQENVTVQMLLPCNLGCPHEYALTSLDLKKVAEANVLVVNGLGMEEFLDDTLRQVNPKLVTIDSSKGVDNLLEYAEDESNESHHQENDHNDGHVHEGEEHEHHHHGENPHLFASPRMSAKLVMNIAGELSKLDTQGAGVYFRNASDYAAKLNALADEMSALGRILRNNRIVQPHGVFDYLARDMGLEIVAVMQAHGQDPSAARIREIVDLVRAKDTGAIITEPQYSSRIGQMLADETGIPLAQLDPMATGPVDAPLDYYEQVIRKNMETLQSVLKLRE